jgi:hypothetical protein
VFLNFALGRELQPGTILGCASAGGRKRRRRKMKKGMTGNG